VPANFPPTTGLPDVTTKVVPIVEYRCARCGVCLAARPAEADGWLRCPQCGCAGLPPEPPRSPRPWGWVRRRESLGDDVLDVGPDKAAESETSVASTEAEPSYRSKRTAFAPGSPRRIMAASLFFVMLLLALLSQLDGARVTARSFILFAAVSLFLALLPSRARRSGVRGHG
jgi:hypothetical protein